MKKTNFLRLIMTLVMGGLLAANVMAVPAKRGWQTRTQTDGTTVEVQLVGDEFYHYLINREGQQVQLNENGMYEVVGPRPTKAQHLARRAQSPRLAGQRRVAKDYGDLQISRILVLLVNFSDVKMQSKYNNAYYTKMLNAETQSVRDYFRASSEGKYVPQFDVFGPYDLDQNEYYYGHNVKIDDEDTDQRPDQMVVDACAKAAADGCDFSNYDTNNDGKVDNVYVIYAGYGENYNGSKEYWIWPHSWEIYDDNVTGTLEYNGKTLGHYACSAELTGISGTDADGLGTFCHEFSHVIGLPDYYDADYEKNGDNEGYTPGQWSLMDQGSYNNDGNSPALYSIYDKYFMGWKTPTILKAPDNIEMPVGGDYARQITSNDVLAKPTNTSTVYYLENRQKEGYDQGLPGHGMLVWQVKYSQKHWEDNDLNNYGGTLLYTIKSANSSSTDLSSSDTPFPGTNNVKKCTPITGHELTEISENAGVITFKYNGGLVKEKCTYTLTGTNCTVPANGEVSTNSALSLTITPAASVSLEDALCWSVKMGSVDLVYGKDFTYNAMTNEFYIAKVTDDVVINATGKKLFDITWYAKGEQFALTTTAGTVTLPATEPAGCGDGKIFVGWCNQSDYSDASAAPTFIKNGDVAAEGAKYYAVFAAETEGTPSYEKATSITVGDEVVLVYETGKKELSSFSTAGKACALGTDYTDKPVGVYPFSIVAGSENGSYAFKHDSKYLNYTGTDNTLTTNGEVNASSSWTVSISGGDATITNVGTTSRTIRWNTGSPRFACYTTGQSAIQLYKKVGGKSYSDYTTSCAACEKKITIEKGSAENGSFALDKLGDVETCGAAVVVGVKDIKPSEGYRFKTITVSGVTGTIDQENKTVTFAKNTTGTATINVVFEEKGNYTITFYNQGSKLDEQTVKEGEKATAPTVSAPCADYMFEGWWTEELAATNTNKKTWITDFTATQDQAYYAIYSKTETSSGDAAASITFKEASKDGSTDLSTVAGGIKNFAESETGFDSYTGEKIYEGKGGLKIGTSSAYGKLSLGLKNDATTKTITIVTNKYGDESVSLKVTVDYSTIFGTKTAIDGTLTYTVSSEKTFSQIDIETTSKKRAYIKSVTIGGGSASSTTYYTSTVNCTSTDLENIQPEPRGRKVMIDGQLFIMIGEQMYTITGTRVK